MNFRVSLETSRGIYNREHETMRIYVEPASMFSNVQLALDLVLQTYFLGRINGYVSIGLAWRSWQSLGVVAVLDACGFQKAWLL